MGVRGPPTLPAPPARPVKLRPQRDSGVTSRSDRTGTQRPPSTTAAAENPP